MLRCNDSNVIHFGQLLVPVKIYPAIAGEESLEFKTLHKGCGTPIERVDRCPVCFLPDATYAVEDVLTSLSGEAQEPGAIAKRIATSAVGCSTLVEEELAKGYEFFRDRYLELSPEQLKEIQSTEPKSIQVIETFPAAHIPREFLDGFSYLGPDKGGDAAFVLMREAMRNEHVGALAMKTARAKQSLVFLRPLKDALVMEGVLYGAQVRPCDIEAPAATPTPEMLELARALVLELRAEEFRPNDYSDQAKKRIQRILEERAGVHGEEAQDRALVAEKSDAPPDQVLSLKEALERSLGHAKSPTPNPPR